MNGNDQFSKEKLKKLERRREIANLLHDLILTLLISIMVIGVVVLAL